MPEVNGEKTFTLEGEIYENEYGWSYAKNTKSQPRRALKRFRLYDEDEPFIVTFYEQYGKQGEASEKRALEPEKLEEATAIAGVRIKHNKIFICSA
jgi:hypothetical protein